MNRQLLVILAGALLVATFVILALLYNSQQQQEISASVGQNNTLLERAYSPTSGDKQAKVTIVEFFDPACETCKVFHPLVKQMMAEHPGKIRLVMRYTPFHQRSDYAVKILEAARLQNKFEETLDVIYETQPIWAPHHNPRPEKLWMLLVKTGLNIDKARKDMETAEIQRRIEQDMADAKQLQVTKTPGFFVNGKPLIRFGYQPLKNLVNSELSKNY